MTTRSEILALDMSTVAVGYAALVNSRLVDYGVHRVTGAIEERVAAIGWWLHSYLETSTRLTHPNVIIEQPFGHANWYTAVKLGYAVGAGMMAAGGYGYPVAVMNPQTRLTYAGIDRRGLSSKQLKTAVVRRARLLYSLSNKELPMTDHDAADAILLAHAADAIATAPGYEEV